MNDEHRVPSMREILSSTEDPNLPLEGQEFYELRLSEEQHGLGARYAVLEIYAGWSCARRDVVWKSEEIEYFHREDEAKKRYAERRAALGEKGFVHSDMID